MQTENFKSNREDKNDADNDDLLLVTDTCRSPRDGRSHKRLSGSLSETAASDARFQEQILPIVCS